jgi:hypothetical protein
VKLATVLPSTCTVKSSVVTTPPALDAIVHALGWQGDTPVGVVVTLPRLTSPDIVTTTLWPSFVNDCDTAGRVYVADATPASETVV